jgi:alanine racemase
MPQPITPRRTNPTPATIEAVKSWIEISSRNLTANYKTLTTHAGAEVLAVIKANAYGHGAALCAPVLARAGAAWLGVTDAAEGIEVREALTQADIALPQQPRILVMSGSLPDEADTIVSGNLTPIVWSLDQLEPLARAAVQQHKQLPVHLELDTGMSRQGCVPGKQLDRLLQWFAAHPSLALDGVMTHFASAEIAGSLQTSDQQQRFERAIQQVHAAGLTPAWIHAGNSSTIDSPIDPVEHSGRWLSRLAHTVAARPMVRSGLSLYGYCLPVEPEQGYAGQASSLLTSHLQPVMTWKARVLDVRSIDPGTRVGYNGTFTASAPMRLALLPIGYADGLRRELSASSPSSGGWVNFGSDRAPIVGRISMNLTSVDVTAIPSVRPGDEAHVLGPGITAADHARFAHTIPYEILCGIKATRCLS